LRNDRTKVYRCGILLCSGIASLTLSGCSFGTLPAEINAPAGATSPQRIQGAAYGGNNPVVGAKVTVWYPGVTGYGSAPTALATTISAAGGSFNFSAGSYTCPAADMPVYITATGGNPGLDATPNWTTNTNTYIALMAYIGPCAAAGSRSVVVNEITTAATVFSVAQFMGAAQAANGSNGVGASMIGSVAGTSATNGGSIGAPVGTVSGGVLSVSNPLVYTDLKNAFATADNLATTQTGSPGPASITNATVSLGKLNAIADALVSCVNSDGLAADSSPCINLAASTPTGVTPTGHSVATDTIQIAAYMALSPTTNVSNVYNNFIAPQQFWPGVSSPPFDWTLSITYTNVGLSYPGALAIDALGQIWVVGSSGSMGLAGISPTGQSLNGGAAFLTSSTPYGSPGGIVVDEAGDIWVANRTKSNNDLVEFNSASPTTYTKYTANAQGSTGCGPGGLTLNPNQDLLFDCTLVASPLYPLNAFQNSGTPAAPSYSVTSATFSNPPTTTAGTSAATALHSDAGGNIWVPGYVSPNCTIAEMVPGGFAGTPSLPTTYAMNSYTGSGSNDYDLAIDASGNVWFACSNELNEWLAATSTVTQFTGGGLSSPRYMAMDGAGDIWLANSAGVTVGSTTYYTVSEFNNAGTPMTPATVSNSSPGGYTVFSGAAGAADARYAAVDGSGNVWVPNYVSGGSSITELVGVAVPVYTPLGTAPLNNRLGSLPASTASTAAFTLSSSPQSVSVAVGSSQVFNIDAQAVNGFSSSVVVTVSGLPSGVTTDSPSYAVTPGEPVAITLTAASGATTGIVSVTLTGSSGSIVRTTQLELTVGYPPDYRLAPSASAVSLTPGSSQSLTIVANALNGFSGSAIAAYTANLPAGVTLTLVPGVAQTLTFTAAANATVGNTMTSVVSTYGATMHDAPIVVNVGSNTQDFSMGTPASLSLNAGGTATFNIYALGAGGFDSNVTVSLSGLPSGVSSSPSGSQTLDLKPGGGNSGSVTLTAASTIAATTTTFLVTGVSGSITHQNTVTLTLAPNGTVAATVNTASPGAAFPPYYVGFSMPDTTLAEFTGTGSSTNPSFVNLLGNLKNYIGSPSIRTTIGGGTSTINELAALESAATFTVGGVTTSPQFFFTVPEGYNPGTAAASVQSRVNALGSANILGFELDNEPDLFVAEGYRAPTWTFSDYLNESAGYQQALSPYLNGRQLIATAASSTVWDVGNPALLSQEGSQLSAFTVHLYGTSNCGSTPPTIANLMEDQNSHQYDSRWAPVVRTVGSIPVRVGEMNSVACSGESGVSNAFAASLWLVDSAFEAKTANAAGFNIHSNGTTSGPVPYDIAYINSSGAATVYAPYYGVLFFSQAIQNGAQPLPVTIAKTSGNVKIWATIDKSGVVRVVVLEKDLDGIGNSRTVSLNLGSSFTGSGTLTTMTAPSLSSTSGITIAGQTFDGTTNGIPTGATTSSSISPAGGIYTITVPDGTAALLTIP
jgi:sugar lactone lactonase YvrE